jgi:hypothetical protein
MSSSSTSKKICLELEGLKTDIQDNNFILLIKGIFRSSSNNIAALIAAAVVVVCPRKSMIAARSPRWGAPWGGPGSWCVPGTGMTGLPW